MMKRIDSNAKLETLEMLNDVRNYVSDNMPVWRQTKTVLERSRLIQNTSNLTGLLGDILAGKSGGCAENMFDDGKNLPSELRELIDLSRALHARTFGSDKTANAA